MARSKAIKREPYYYIHGFIEVRDGVLSRYHYLTNLFYCTCHFMKRKTTDLLANSTNEDLKTTLALTALGGEYNR